MSPLIDLADGEFQRIISDSEVQRSGVKRVLLCSGKIYYDLEKFRETNRREDVAILRVEQLYPLREEHLAAALDPYLDGTPVFWVQEEPENMGAWRYLLVTFGVVGLLFFVHTPPPPFLGRFRPAREKIKNFKNKESNSTICYSTPPPSAPRVRVKKSGGWGRFPPRGGPQKGGGGGEGG